MLRSYTRHGEKLDIHEGAAPTLGEPPVWIDLLDPTDAEREAVENRLGLSIPSREAVEEIEVSSRLYAEEDARFMTIIGVANVIAASPTKSPITFVLKPGVLVTVRYVELKPFDSFASQFKRDSKDKPHDAEAIMLGLLEAIIDRLADALEHISDAVDTISHSVFKKDPKQPRKSPDLQSAIDQIGHRGDTLSMIQESLVSLRRLITYHGTLADAGRKTPHELRQRIKLIEDDLVSLSDHAGFLNNKIAFLLDATLGLINLDQNNTIKIFSVAAVVFLPPTLVASIYGMNFRYMPELEWLSGYPFALFLMIISALGTYWFFKRKNWL